MKTRSIQRLVAMTALAACVCPLLARGQAEDQPQDNQAPRSTSQDVQEVIQLDNLDAGAAASIIKSVEPRCRSGIDRESNTLVVAGPADAVASVKSMLRSLDEQTHESGDIQSAIIRVGEDVSGEMNGLIRALISHRTEFAVDHRLGLIVLRGPAGEIAEVKKLVAEIEAAATDYAPTEAPSSPLQLSFFFIQGQTGGRTLAAGRQAPSHAVPAAPVPSESPLDTPVTVEFVDTMLSSVFETLAKKGKLNLAVIWADLESEGIDPDTPVTLSITRPASLGQVFDIVFDLVGADSTELGIDVNDDVARIATRAYLDRQVQTKVYDVADLLEGASSYDSPPPEAVAKDLLVAIQNTVKPDSWRSNGGAAASADILDRKLIVKQTDSAQMQIAELLRALRQEGEQTQAVSSATSFPDALKPVADALAEAGFHDPALLASLRVRARQEEGFDINGIANQPSGGLQVRVRGQAERHGKGDVVDIEVSAMARPLARANGNAPAPLFDVDTSVATRVGDYVILAASPAPTGHGQVIALAVRVTVGP